MTHRYLELRTVFENAKLGSCIDYDKQNKVSDIDSLKPIEGKQWQISVTEN